MATHPLALALLLVIACNDSEATSASSSTTTGITTTTGTTADPTSTSDPLTTTATTGATTTTTTTDPLTTTTTTGGPLTLTECPTVAAPVQVATVDDPSITESSGLIASRTQPGVFWVHNDSGDKARFFALDAAGARLGTFKIKDIDADDWEAMAAGPGPAPGEWLYFGDIGDNPEKRDVITVHRLPEPDAAAAGGGAVFVDGAEAIDLVYPDAPHNAETLLVDPQSGDLLIVIKDDPTRIFHLPAPLTAGGPHTLAELVPIAFPATVATGGDISPLGDFIVVRTYAQAFLWLRPPGVALADAFAAEPCAIPLAIEPQGETISVARDGSGYYTLSEGEARPLYWYAFE